MDHLRLLNLFKSAIESISLYPAGNPMVERSFASFHQLLNETMASASKLDIQVQDGILIVDGDVQADRISRSGAGQWLLKTALEQRIRRIEFLQGLTRRELVKLAQLLNRPARDVGSPGEAVDWLASQDVNHVRINRSEVASVAPEPETRPAPARQQMTDFHLPLEDVAALKQDVGAMVRENKLKQLAEVLGLICEDMVSTDRAMRELALPSYRVVADVLMDHGQAKPLQNVVRAMARDLERMDERDLFAYHLKTFARILVYFRDQGVMAPVAFGLQALAKLARDDDQVKRDLATAQLPDICNEPCVAMIIQSIEQRGQLSPVFIRLVEHQGELFVHPLLDVLFATQDRNLRRGIMNLLKVMGPVIYPELIAETKNAFSRDSPWYVLRNLLQLLSVNPPLELIPIVESHLGFEHPKVRDLIHRCILSIQHKDAFQLGKRLILTAPDEDKVRLLNHVGNGGVKAFAPILTSLVEGDTEEDVKRAAIIALVRLDSRDGLEFIEALMASGPILMNKLHNGLRVAAAEALFQQRSDRALPILARCTNDRDKAVREIANRVLVSHAHKGS